MSIIVITTMYTLLPSLKHPTDLRNRTSSPVVLPTTVRAVATAMIIKRVRDFGLGSRRFVHIFGELVGKGVMF